MPTALTDEDAFQEAGSHPRLRTGLREPPGLTAGQSSAAAQEGNLPVSPAPYKGPASSTAFLPPSSSSSSPPPGLTAHAAPTARCQVRAGVGWRRSSPTSTLRAPCSATSAVTARVSWPTLSVPAAAASPSSTPPPAGPPPRAPCAAAPGTSEGPAPTLPDVHIYIGCTHTASIFIYLTDIMDQAMRGSAAPSPRPRDALLPLLLMGRWDGPRGQEGGLSGALFDPILSVPFLCQALQGPGRLIAPRWCHGPAGAAVTLYITAPCQ